MEYKYVVLDTTGSVVRWQEDPNVSMDIPTAVGHVEVVDSWCQGLRVVRQFEQPAVTAPSAGSEVSLFAQGEQPMQQAVAIAAAAALRHQISPGFVRRQQQTPAAAAPPAASNRRQTPPQAPMYQNNIQCLPPHSLQRSSSGGIEVIHLVPDTAHRHATAQHPRSLVSLQGGMAGIDSSHEFVFEPSSVFAAASSVHRARSSSIMHAAAQAEMSVTFTTPQHAHHDADVSIDPYDGATWSREPVIQFDSLEPDELEEAMTSALLSDDSAACCEACTHISMAICSCSASVDEHDCLCPADAHVDHVDGNHSKQQQLDMLWAVRSALSKSAAIAAAHRDDPAHPDLLAADKRVAHATRMANQLLLA